MKIKTIKGKILDTHKMSDMEAEIHEASANLFSVCERYGLTMFSRIILNNKKYVGAQNQYHDKPEDLEFLYELMDEHARNVSGNKVRLVKIVE